MRADLQPFCSGTHKWVPKILLLLTLALSASGCSLLKNTLELPEKGIRSMLSLNQGNDAPDPVELQSQLLRFADNYIDAINLASRRLAARRRHARRAAHSAEAAHRHHQRCVGHRHWLPTPTPTSWTWPSSSA